MRQFFSRVYSVVFSRFVITVLLVLLQAGYIGLLLFRLENYAWYLGVFFAGLAVITDLFVIWRDYNPAYKVAWIFLITLLPAIGVVAYVFFGNKKPARRMRKRLEPVDKAHLADLAQVEPLEQIEDERLRDTCRYIGECGHFPMWRHTETRFFTLGDHMFPALIQDLKAARHFIFLEFFIIGEGTLWREIEKILIEKAERGVDIRIIYDDVGSMKVIPKNFIKRMKNYGIKVIAFNPVLPILNLMYNNRDHRKIAVIDGYIGYTGGVNIADEYANREVRFGHWKDTAVRLYGEAVWNFTVMFLNMWNGFRPEEKTYDKFRPEVHHPEAFPETPGFIQPYGDSPLDEEHVGESVYLEIINQAKEYIYISTPYLIIDNEMQVALELAAKRGVKVVIMTPHIPDKPMIFALTRSYYDMLMERNIKIIEYTPGFVHSKVFVADDKVATVGTINMDYRSFFFHFECGTLLIDDPSIADIRRDYEETAEKCVVMSEGAHYKNFFSKLFGAVLRLISPLV